MQATTFSKKRKAFHREMAEAYLKFLTYIFVENEGNTSLYKALNDARNKFLSNYFIENAPIPSLFPEESVQCKRFGGNSSRRYLLGDYYSKGALQVLRDGTPTKGRLRFEHMVPKGDGKMKFEGRIKSPINALRSADIRAILDEEWHIAVITEKEERSLLPRKTMPLGWERAHGVFARYCTAQKPHFRLWRTVEDEEICSRHLV